MSESVLSRLSRSADPAALRKALSAMLPALSDAALLPALLALERCASDAAREEAAAVLVRQNPRQAAQLLFDWVRPTVDPMAVRLGEELSRWSKQQTVDAPELFFTTDQLARIWRQAGGPEISAVAVAKRVHRWLPTTQSLRRLRKVKTAARRGWTWQCEPKENGASRSSQAVEAVE